MTKDEANKLLEKSFDQKNIALLHEAMQAGADINHKTSLEEPLLSGLLYEFGCECRYELSEIDEFERPVNYVGNFNLDEEREKVIAFIGECIKYGIDLNAYEEDCGDKYYIAYEALKWQHDNLGVAQFLFENGARVDLMLNECSSIYDGIAGDVFAEECCGNYDWAKDLYNGARLIIAYGGKSADYMNDELPADKKQRIQSVILFDFEAIERLTREEILTDALDAYLFEWACFANGPLFYWHPELFQQKMIKALEIILKNISADELCAYALYECVYQQLPDVLDFLLAQGVDPNQNCFNGHYAFVKSSALYELNNRGRYYNPENAERMRTSLLAAHAMVG